MRLRSSQGSRRCRRGLRAGRRGVGTAVAGPDRSGTGAGAASPKPCRSWRGSGGAAQHGTPTRAGAGASTAQSRKSGRTGRVSRGGLQIASRDWRRGLAGRSPEFGATRTCGRDRRPGRLSAAAASSPSIADSDDVVADFDPVAVAQPVRRLQPAVAAVQDRCRSSRRRAASRRHRGSEPRNACPRSVRVGSGQRPVEVLVAADVEPALARDGDAQRAAVRKAGFVLDREAQAPSPLVSRSRPRRSTGLTVTADPSRAARRPSRQP